MSGRRGRHADQLQGQSLVELAILLPVLLILLLGATDLAQVLSTEVHLEDAAHEAALNLVTTPSLSNAAALASYLQSSSGLAPISAGTTYSVSGDGADQVVITATYNYPLLMPGLRNLQLGAIGNGKLKVTVSASGIAATSSPSLSYNSGTKQFAVSPATDGTVPAGLALTCRLYKNGSSVASSSCSTGTPFQWTDTYTTTASYTATTTQVNGLESPGSTSVTAP
jgi:hypothetical protein